MDFVIPPPATPSVPVQGCNARFPIHRIYGIGRNYAEHAMEMGTTIDRGNPIFFSKPADTVVTDNAEVRYPGVTANLHHEVEMVLALHGGGRDIPLQDALDVVFGYAVGLDLTRRDLQSAAKAAGLPWDTSKGFDDSAPISSIRRVAEIGHPSRAQLSLEVDGTLRQQADIAAMVFKPAELIAELSKYFELRPGDLIFTGTPAGVAPLVRGNRFAARLDGIAEFFGRIV